MTSLNEAEIERALQQIIAGYGAPLRPPIPHTPAEHDLKFEDVMFPSEDGVPPGSAPGAVTGPTVDRFRLDGKVAVVTGARRGIGRGAAIALAEAGANVAVISRSRTDLDSVARVIHGMGRDCSPLAVDVRNIERFTALLDELPRIDIFVGIGRLQRAGAVHRCHRRAPRRDI